MDTASIWSKALKELRNEVSQANFHTWFASLRLASLEENQQGGSLAIMSSPNNFSKEHLEKRYKKLIERVLEKVSGEKTEVVLKIAQKKPRGNGHSSTLWSAMARPKMPSVGLTPRFSFDNFIVGAPNQLAFAAAQAIVQRPGLSYNPLFIYGSVGVGKTHLLQATGNQIAKIHPSLRILYTSCEQFTNDFIESIVSRSQARFREKYRGTDVLLIDDVQFLAGRDQTQEEFFHTFNQLHLTGKQIALTSDRHPAEIGRLEDRLVSRFLGGLTCDIGSPDPEMRSAIIRQKLAELNLALSSEVIDHLAQNFVTNAREIEGLLTRIHSFLLLSNQPITLGGLPQILGLPQEKKTLVPARLVFGAVGRYFGLSKGDFLGPRRDQKTALARQILMYLLKHLSGLTYEGTGKLLGGRDHSTIIHGVEKVAALLGKDHHLRNIIFEIKQEIN